MFLHAALPTLILASGAVLTSRPASPPQSEKRITSLSVVVNSKNGVKNLSQDDLKEILKRKTKEWPKSGVRIKVVLPPSDSTAGEVLRIKVYKKPIKKYFKKKNYRGKGGGVFFGSDAAVLKKVRETPGAIAVVATSAVPEDPQLRVLTISSRGPKDMGYFLMAR